MEDAASSPNAPWFDPRGWASGWRRWRNAKAADPAFQTWASRTPVASAIARRDGERLFDIVAGFVHSQVLLALVELDVLDALRDRDLSAAALALGAGVEPARMEALCRAGVALDLMERAGDGYGLSRLGAALLGAPGLTDMVRHHRVLYRDLEDPAAFLRGGGDTELAKFWPYVFGAGAASDPEISSRYSDLMTRSLTMVAEETLRAVSLSGVERLLDIGGGGGAFLAAAGRAWPDLRLTLFDLPGAVADAPERLDAAGVAGRAEIAPGSFRDDPLPRGADAISLIRVLYDHEDETVAALLRGAHDALSPGGRLIISEPMSGGAAPTRAGDAYFAFYTMAMGTGRTRSAEEITALATAAGFVDAAPRRTRRPFITSVVTARKTSS